MAENGIQSENRRDALILHVSGPLTMERSQELRHWLDQASPAKIKRVIVDFAACPRMDSTGIAVLVTAYKRARDAGTGFILVNIGPQILSILQLTRLDRIFDTRSTIEAALA